MINIFFDSLIENLKGLDRLFMVVVPWYGSAQSSSTSPSPSSSDNTDIRYYYRTCSQISIKIIQKVRYQYNTTADHTCMFENITQQMTVRKTDIKIERRLTVQTSGLNKKGCLMTNISDVD